MGSEGKLDYRRFPNLREVGMRKSIRRFLLICLLDVLQVETFHLGAQAFENNAHTQLTRRAVDVSILDDFLKTQLSDFVAGMNELIIGEDTVIKLVQNGSVDEDKPVIRVRHHFHDPTKTWDQAGLTTTFGFPGLSAGMSSAVWGQGNQVILGSYSWQDARSYYLTALTNTTATFTERKRIYATLFRSIGHLIHLIQDAATPSHTRNDWHPPWRKDYFHQWSESSTGLTVMEASGVTRSHVTIFGLP
jgi:hypothetical protein